MLKVLAGYEEVPKDDDELVGQGWLTDAFSDCSWCISGNVGKCRADGVRYIRPCRERTSEVKCPNCGSGVIVHHTATDVSIACDGSAGKLCGLVGPRGVTLKAAIDVFSRLRLEPEPLRCPSGCGGHVEFVESGDGTGSMVCDCGISGKDMPTTAEAEVEFRKLSYNK